METLSKDVLFNIATMLDLDDLLSLCSSNSRINRLICQRNDIWLFKLVAEFPDWNNYFDADPKNTYILLVKLKRIAEAIDYHYSVYELYDEHNLYIDRKRWYRLSDEIKELIDKTLINPTIILE
jgi:hypothetical protein